MTNLVGSLRGPAGWFLGAIVLTCALLTFAPGSARADFEFFTPSGAKNGSDGALSAEAYFTVQNGQITVYLANFISGIQDQGQALSGISFKLDGSINSNLTLCSVSGNEVTLSNGTFSATNSGNLYQTYTASGTPATAADWTYNNPNNGKDKVVSLNDANSHPVHMIVGPNASFSGGGGTNFNPYFQSTATSLTNLAAAPQGSSVVFVLKGSAITTNSTISDVDFFFGTGPDQSVVADGGGFVNAVPVPSSLVLALTGCVPFGLAGLWRLRGKVVGAAA